MKNRTLNIFFMITLFMILIGTGRVALAAVLNSDATLINVDSNNVLLYWLEGDPDSLRIQRSTDGGINWLTPTTVANIPTGLQISDFDGIHAIGDTGSLIAAFAVFRVSTNSAHLMVYVSNDFGATWSSPTIVFSLAGGSELGCPSLTTSYNPLSDTISLHTTLISNSGQARIYYVSSNDGGSNWNPQQQLSVVPAICLDD